MNRRCIVCDHSRVRAHKGTSLCDPCGRAYDRYSRAGGGSVWDVIVWAARRARRYARRRGPKAIEP